MSKYDLGIIDGELVLRRNYSANCKGQNANGNLLLKTFIQSIMKIKRENDFEKALICFDSFPYYKTMEVQNYKADRPYESQEGLDALREELLWASDEEREELEKQIEEYEKRLNDKKVYWDVKKTIKESLGRFGFYPLYKKFFESDDIAYGISEKVREKGLTAILVTKDSDWMSFRSKEVEYVNLKGDHRYPDVKRLLDESRVLGVPMYEIGVLHEIYDASHNNVSKYEFRDMVRFDEFAHKLYNQDSSLMGFDDINKTYKSMNIRHHLPELDKLIDFSLSRTDLASPMEWQQFLRERRINISWSTYEKFRRNCNKNYLEEKNNEDDGVVQQG